MRAVALVAGLAAPVVALQAAPVDAEAVDAESVDAESVDAEQVDAAQVDAESIDAEPFDAAPTWSERVEWSDDGPAAREHPSLFRFDGQVVVFGGSGYTPQGAPLGDAWAYDLAERSWRPLALSGDVPAPAGSRRVAQAPGAEHGFVFGGYAEQFATNAELFRVELADGALSFTRIEQIDPPPARALHAFAHDPESSRLVVTHGVAREGLLGDTWVGAFDAEGRVRWEPIEAGPGPRFGAAHGFDPRRGELLLLGGQVPGSDAEPMPMSQDLWVLDCRADPPRWRHVDVEFPPPGRRNPQFVFDPAASALVVWCGTADARSNVPGLVRVAPGPDGEWAVETFADDGCPPRRSSGTGFVEAESSRVWFGFGNSREGQYRDWCALE